MISAIRKKLSAMDKANCESDSLIGQEKGRGVKLTPSSNGKAMKIKVDDCLITDTRRCDCLYFYQQSKSKRHSFLVELKGNNYAYALEQLEATKNHPNYIALMNENRPCNELAVAIVSKKARTNNPKKEEWEDLNQLRLMVIPIEDNDTYDLRMLTKSA
ncbi:hypothetical protein [Methylomonas rivi]|uniref:Protein NO VEIN C-terminal domain-containing protein n=1 Tax=Methylomonas rivi TaxID=2952226 RepID=A0ABT1TZS3_9GAMM|nr:hypothetical protein [Methylomonas sp. WSC-6]MCQ8127066.1 hypothetical protein [Methylomonas sp. WSC-6]